MNHESALLAEPLEGVAVQTVLSVTEVQARYSRFRLQLEDCRCGEGKRFAVWYSQGGYILALCTGCEEFTPFLETTFLWHCPVLHCDECGSKLKPGRVSYRPGKPRRNYGYACPTCRYEFSLAYLLLSDSKA